MPLFFITGASGTGKSSVVSALKHRGYEAYDVDERGPVTAKWHNNITGYVHPKSSINTEDRTPEFIKNHSWNVPRQEVLELLAKSTTRAVFVAGAIANEAEIQDLFQTIFVLQIDDETLKYRLMNRIDNDWGKHPHELEQSLEHNRKMHEVYESLGYTTIDATQPLDNIVDEILNQFHEK
ncbi:MAG TPA: hypothetical protein VFL85_00700 [Candidatus Saccharimonadales bacterium]|nr:hypothetical protein [Candidatus Saccharimonadales bacterium]